MTQQNLKKIAQNLPISPLLWMPPPPSSGHLIIPPLLGIFRNVDPPPSPFKKTGGRREGVRTMTYIFRFHLLKMTPFLKKTINSRLPHLRFLENKE